MSSTASVVALAAPTRRFHQYESAMRAVGAYERRLCEDASRRRAMGLGVTDQDQPDEAFCQVPEEAVEPPLAIVGGMGPLAGAQAFRRACARFRNSRVVALYQACSMPDRSTVILRERGQGTSACLDMAARLAEAVRLVVDVAGAADQPPRCIVACNSAHYFWPAMQQELADCPVRMISLVESSVEALKTSSCRRALLLATEGARVGQVFSAPCREAGVAAEEPSPQLSQLLMRAIFEGIKSFNNRRAVELGNEFFEAVLESNRECDCILAGCTEIPLTIDLLKRRGSAGVAAFLSRARIVDPVEEALRRA